MKRERWVTVTYKDPATGTTCQVSSRAGCCPNCGQRRCTRVNPVCIEVQKAIKEGRVELFTM